MGFIHLYGRVAWRRVPAAPYGCMPVMPQGFVCGFRQACQKRLIRAYISNAKPPTTSIGASVILRHENMA